jgi:hypothetical protein
VGVCQPFRQRDSRHRRRRAARRRPIARRRTAIDRHRAPRRACSPSGEPCGVAEWRMSTPSSRG